jgi:hypothetical protein
MTQERGSDKLTRLQKAGLSVASVMLTWKTHLALAIFLYLFQLILDDDGHVNQVLQISVEQLKQHLILETLEKRILLLLISVDVIGGLP